MRKLNQKSNLSQNQTLKIKQKTSCSVYTDVGISDFFYFVIRALFVCLQGLCCKRKNNKEKQMSKQENYNSDFAALKIKQRNNA